METSASKYYSPWDKEFSGRIMVLDKMEPVTPIKLTYNGLVEIEDEKGFLHRVHERDLWELRLQLVGGSVVNIPDDLVREIVTLNTKIFRVDIDSQIISLIKNIQNVKVSESTQTVNGSNKPRTRIVLRTSDDDGSPTSTALIVRPKNSMGGE